MDDSIIARRYFVSGIVQGVGFRYFAQRTAARFNVKGYTRNVFDGRVEVYAIGPPAALEAFRDELRRGPRGASVSGVSEEEDGVREDYADGFSIEYDA